MVWAGGGGETSNPLSYVGVPENYNVGLDYASQSASLFSFLPLTPSGMKTEQGLEGFPPPPPRY